MMGKNNKQALKKAPHMPFLVQCLPRGHTTLDVGRGSYGKFLRFIAPCPSVFSRPSVMHEIKELPLKSSAEGLMTTGQRARGVGCAPRGEGPSFLPHTRVEEEEERERESASFGVSAWKFHTRRACHQDLKKLNKNKKMVKKRRSCTVSDGSAAAC